MSRFLRLLSILAIVALIALPAFAEVQNVKVSGDIDSKMVNRADYDLCKGNANNSVNSNYKDVDTWFMSTARVQVDADLTDNVSTCVRVLNERDWGEEEQSSPSNANDTDIDLDLASVKMKEMFYAPLTLTIGRQNIRLGSGLVVGDPDTNDRVSGASTITAPDLSVRKSFDAIRATLDYNPLTVDLIYAKIDANTIGIATTAGTKTNDDVNLYAINAAYKFDKYNSEAEAYFVGKSDRSDTDSTGGPVTDKVYVYGVRGSLEPISKLVLDAELALQDGDYADTANNRKIDRSAWAADISGTYAIDYKWSPKIGLGYSYRSGQKTNSTNANTDVVAADSKYKAWDVMFEDQTHGIIANKIFSDNNDGVDSNSHIINVKASVEPIKDLTVALDYYHYSLAQKWYSTGTSGAAADDRIMNAATGTSYEVKNKKDLGDEIDLSLAYDYTEDVKLGLTAGLFLPGSAFQTSNDKTASTVIADVSVAF